NWTYGKWLTGSTVLFSVSTQAQMFLLAGLLGLGATGILRAMQLPSLIATQGVTATSLLFLPVLSKELGLAGHGRMKHKAWLVSMGLAIAGICFGVFLMFFCGQAEQLLFGGKFVGYAWLMPLLALIPVATGLTSGFSMVLRILQGARYEFFAYLV